MTSIQEAISTIQAHLEGLETRLERIETRESPQPTTYYQVGSAAATTTTSFPQGVFSHIQKLIPLFEPSDSWLSIGDVILMLDNGKETY